MEKHYCEKCGTELIMTRTEDGDNYDANSGKRNIHYEYRWKCPNVRWWHWSSHTNLESFLPDFDAALKRSHTISLYD